MYAGILGQVTAGMKRRLQLSACFASGSSVHRQFKVGKQFLELHPGVALEGFLDQCPVQVGGEVLDEFIHVAAQEGAAPTAYLGDAAGKQVAGIEGYSLLKRFHCLIPALFLKQKKTFLKIFIGLLSLGCKLTKLRFHARIVR